MKDKIFCICALVIVGLMAHASGAVTAVSVDRETFFGTSVADRAWHAQIIEQGTGPSLSLYEMAIGDGNFLNPSETGQITWTVGVAQHFTLVFDEPAGNLTLQIGAETLIDQPMKAFNQIYVANDNTTGLSFQHMSLTNMLFNEQALPSMFTSGPENFQGYFLTGPEVMESWTLEGDVTWSSDIGGLGHGSDFPFYGYLNSDLPIPEPSTYLLLFFGALVALKRHRSNR